MCVRVRGIGKGWSAWRTPQFPKLTGPPVSSAWKPLQLNTVGKVCQHADSPSDRSAAAKACYAPLAVGRGPGWKCSPIRGPVENNGLHRPNATNPWVHSGGSLKQLFQARAELVKFSQVATPEHGQELTNHDHPYLGKRKRSCFCASAAGSGRPPPS